MIVKYYSVYCDLCNNPLGAMYCNYKPTPTTLRNNGVKVIINNGKIHTYCEDCYNRIKSKEK